MHANSIYQIILMVLTWRRGLSVIGGLSVLTFTKTFGTIFLGHQTGNFGAHNPTEVSLLDACTSIFYY